MNKESSSTNQVRSHYNAVSQSYGTEYDRERLRDLSQAYPANFFRLQLLMDSFTRKNIQRVMEVGVGEGTPLTTMGKAGIDVWGFDIAEGMVEKAREQMRQSGFDPEHVFLGDIQDSTTYGHALEEGLFDGVVAMGVMPHVADDDLAIKNIASMVKPGGSVFIEFRNKLFSLFTMNRYTRDFILDDLLQGVDGRLKEMVAKELDSRLRVDMPPLRATTPEGDAPGYDAILSKFHNPFEVLDLYQRNGLTDAKFLWYHYHPAMPYLDEKAPELFREESIKLEHEISNWRGFFLCSAFVVEAVKKG